MTAKIKSLMRRNFELMLVVILTSGVAGMVGSALLQNARERSREILYSQAEKIADTDGDGILSPDEKARMYIDIQTENLTRKQLRRYIQTHQNQNYNLNEALGDKI